MTARACVKEFGVLILHFKPGVAIAVIEAKYNNHSVGAGMRQAIACQARNQAPRS